MGRNQRHREPPPLLYFRVSNSTCHVLLFLLAEIYFCRILKGFVGHLYGQGIHQYFGYFLSLLVLSVRSSTCNIYRLTIHLVLRPMTRTRFDESHNAYIFLLHLLEQHESHLDPSTLRLSLFVLPGALLLYISLGGSHSVGISWLWFVLDVASLEDIFCTIFYSLCRWAWLTLFWGTNFILCNFCPLSHRVTWLALSSCATWLLLFRLISYNLQEVSHTIYMTQMAFLLCEDFLCDPSWFGVLVWLVCLRAELICDRYFDYG